METTTEPRFVPVARVEDVPSGWVATVRIDGVRSVALANVDGSFHAVDASCSHAGGPLGDSRLRDGCLLRCTWHDSVFDVTSGEVRAGPARKPQRTYPVRVEDGLVLVGVT